MKYLRKVLTVTAKDLRIEARSHDRVPSMIVFSLIVIVIFNFSFEPGLENRAAFAPGVLLVAFSFAGLLGLSRSFALEREHEAIQGLLLAPVDRSALYLGKMLSNFIFLIIIMIFSLAALGFFFNIGIFPLMHRIWAIIGLTVLGFVAVGTLYAAMATNIRLREILLPILFFPIIVPIIIAAVKALDGVFLGQKLSEVGSWLKLLAAYDVIFIVVGILTFEYVISE